ncbi:MAG: hypothetical protein ABSF83_12270, partial [Nitrososphaerales archaeon]
MKADRAAYFPRRIAAIAPLGEGVHHLVVVARHGAKGLSEVAELLARHDVNLLNGGTYESAQKREFLFNVYVDTSEADCSTEVLVAQLKDLPSVLAASASRTEDEVYDQRLFPVELFEKYRAAIVPAESMVSMERDLEERIGRQGLHVLFEVGRSTGLGLSAHHRKMLPDAGKEILLGAALDDVRALGWGLVSVEMLARMTPLTRVKVREPIFAGIRDASSSWWLMGLVSGFLEATFGHRTVPSAGTEYDA